MSVQDTAVTSEGRLLTAVAYLIGAVAIVALWSIFSKVVILWLASAQDNPDMAARVPSGLRFTCAIAFFPANTANTQLLSTVSSPDDIRVPTQLGILFNGFFWATVVALLSVLICKVARRLNAFGGH